jgi:hypothetical protein
MTPAWRWLVAVIIVLAAVGCSEPAPPSPTPSPPTAPTIRVGDWSASNGRWTFNATVNPRGSPTDVVLEYGFGPESAPVFDHVVPAEQGLFDAAAVTVTVDIGEDEPFCARFTATNDVGVTFSEPRCHDWLPSGLIVVPGPADSGSPSAAP